jgi:hypothetical protein
MHCISISYDWISLYCFKFGNFEDLPSENLTIVKQFYSTKVYRDVHIVYVNSLEFATITSVPLSPVLNPAGAIIKFHNKICYEPDIAQILPKILQLLNLKFQSISRLDVCADFQKFNKNLDPSTFINKFLVGKFLKLTKSTWKVYGTQKVKNTYNQISFGSATSWLTIKLYNKFLEQKEVAVKPWIIDKCQQAGIDTDQDFWRCEFSLKSTDNKIIDTDGCVIFDKSDLSIIDYNEVTNQFSALFNEHFVFVKYKPIAHKSRMDKLQLLDIPKEKFIISRRPKGQQGQRAHKIFANKYYKLTMDLRESSNTLHLMHAQTLIDYIDRHGLEAWANKKGLLESPRPTHLIRELAASYLEDTGKVLEPLRSFWEPTTV